MLKIFKEKSFEKDIKVLVKKHYKFDKLGIVIELLSNEKPLPTKYNDHSLSGDKQGYRECHIESNLILVYKVIDDLLVLYRIGSHKDILGK